jgi:hypothetical protein
MWFPQKENCEILVGKPNYKFLPLILALKFNGDKLRHNFGVIINLYD